MNRRTKQHLITSEHYDQEIESLKYLISINRDLWDDDQIEEVEQEIEALKAEKHELYNLMIE